MAITLTFASEMLREQEMRVLCTHDVAVAHVMTS